MITGVQAQRDDSDSVQTCLSLKALSVMVQRFGELPLALRDLCKNVSDFKENRTVRVSEQIGVSDLHSLLNNTRFNIVDLWLDSTFNKQLPPLPRGLKSLCCGNLFDQDITLNDDLEELYMGDAFNKDLFLPETLKELYTGSAFAATRSSVHVGLCMFLA